jgi:serine/threonine protein kinase
MISKIKSKYNKKENSKSANNSNSRLNNKKTFKKTFKTNKFISKMQGGKYIDKGGFGCVVSPAVPCSHKDKNMDKLVSKITNEDVTNEIKIMSILRKLDPTKKYYLTTEKYCYMNTIPENRNDIVNVRFIDDKFSKFEIEPDQEKKDKNACAVELSLHPVNMIMEYGGYSLSSIMKINRKSKGTRALMHQMFIDNLQTYFKHLILGIVKMHNNRIVNRDIKQRNIMMNWNKENNSVAIRYIDFGLSEFLTTDFCQHINNINRNGTSIYIAPEIHIATIIRKYNSRSESYITRKIISEINSSIRKALTKINQHELLANLDKNIFILYEKIKKLFDNNKILSIYFGTDKNKFNGYIQKNDVYALGYSIFETLYIYSEIDIHKNTNLYDLLMHMIALDPDKRYNAVQCLSHPFFQN